MALISFWAYKKRFGNWEGWEEASLDGGGKKMEEPSEKIKYFQNLPRTLLNNILYQEIFYMLFASI